MLAKYFFYAFLLILPLGYRTEVFRWTSGFDEYEAAFLYVSDIFLILFLFAALFAAVPSFSRAGSPLARKHSPASIGAKKRWHSCHIWLFVFLLFAFFSIFWAPVPLLALYNFVRLLLLVLVAFAISRLITNYQLLITRFFAILAGLAVFESLLGFLQFLSQQSLGITLGLGRGLWFLGEQTVGPNIAGSAKFLAEGGALLRAYGTFPHPNVLGAFLVLGLLSLYYFWLKRPPGTFARSHSEYDVGLKRPSEKKMWSGWSVVRSDLFWGIQIFIVLTGIILTFSRTAWLISIFITLLTTFYSLRTKYWIQAVRLLFFLLAATCLLLATFRPFVFPRATITASEPAAAYRLLYNKIGMELIKSNPFGVGIGNQVIYSVKNDVYKNAGLTKVWEWQPIHNIYLLIGAEVGVLGLLAFLGFIAAVFMSAVSCPAEGEARQGRQLRVVQGQKAAIPLLMLMSLLLFGLADHFLWTLQPGRLMLWIVVGLAMGTGNSSKQA